MLPGDNDISTDLQGQVNQALENSTALCISGGNSKHWYGGPSTGETLSLATHQGIVDYEPTELVITARSGTPLSHITATLDAENQLLPFEPPHFGTQATLGGTIATNFSGPARPYSGAARDLVLGCKILNGKGEILSFGGQVMKNVAGYDVSRLMAGSLGTLGVILEVSLKVLPRAERETTLTLEMDTAAALERMCAVARLSLPISAACYHDKQLYLRLSGTAGAVAQAQKTLSGEVLNQDKDFWQRLREHQLDFFNQGKGDVWRLSLPSDTPVMALDGEWLYDWGGAQRWLIPTQDPATIRTATEQSGGHATLFRRRDPSPAHPTQAFHPLSNGLLRYQRQLKAAFDPQGIFNPQRLYPEF